MKANLDKNLAPAWVSGKSYSTGEFCLYNKRLYICITDNSDVEFNISKWEIRNLVDLVSGINSNLNNNISKTYTCVHYNTSMVEVGRTYLTVTCDNGEISMSVSGTRYNNFFNGSAVVITLPQ